MATATAKSLLAPPLLIKTHVVLYDGERCSAASFRSGLSRQDVLKRFIFIQPTHWSEASTAALEVAEHMQFPWPLLGSLKVVPVPIRDAVYDAVAKNRYRMFGRSDTCQVPDKDIIDRCIDADELLQGKCLNEAMKEEEQ